MFIDNLFLFHMNIWKREINILLQFCILQFSSSMKYKHHKKNKVLYLKNVNIL